MKTRQDTLLNFIGASDTQLLIHVYQRVYSWSPRQCDTLWDDAVRAGLAGNVHFIGTVLYADDPSGDEDTRRLDVIDGQQRVVTVSLLMLAIRDFLTERSADLDGTDATALEGRWLRYGTQPKVVLSRMDRATMEALLDGTELPEEDDLSAKVVENYQHFLDKLKKAAPDEVLALWRGLQLLLVVLAEMDSTDRPQLIFESLNAKGMPLTTADLVRNLLLVNASLEEQERLYARYWEPVEKLYGDEEGSTRLNAALHGWLAVTAPRLRVRDKDQVYSAFKQYLDTVENRSLEEILIGLKGFCETFAAKSAAEASKPKQMDWDTKRSGQLISEKKLFGS